MNQLDKNTQNLEKLLLHAERSMSALLMDKTYRKLRTKVLFDSMELIIHNAFAINTLANTRHSYAARSILRNLYEIWVNIYYIYLTQNYSNLIRFLYSSEDEYMYGLRQLKTFADSSPELNPMLTANDLKIISKRRNQELRSLRAYNLPLVKMPDLRTRALQIDRVNGDHAFETQYFNWYRASSMSTHSAPIMISAMQREADYVFIKGNHDDLIQVTTMTYIIMLDSLAFLRMKLRLQLDLDPYYVLFNDFID